MKRSWVQRIFLTRESFDDAPEGLGGRDVVAVFLPMSYQIGGFTVFVPRARTTPVDLTIEEGMRLALTAAMAVKKPDAPAKEMLQ
jgi:uncharacterized membrane protein